MMLYIAVMVIYFAVMMAIGFVAMSRIRTVEDLYIGGRRVGGTLTALSFFTTYFSSVIFIGATALGWRYGLPIVWKDVFVVLVGTLAAFTILGPRLMLLSKKLNFMSVTEFIERRYRSKLAGLIASIAMLVGLFVYGVSIVVGMARATEVVMKIDYIYALAVATIVTTIYTIYGGYFGQVWTQAIQAVFMLAMAVALCIASLIATGGLSNLVESLRSIEPSLAGWPYRDFMPLFLFYVSLGFLGWGNPALVMRFIGIRDRVSLRSATVIATVTTATLTLSLNIASAASRVVVGASVKPDHAFTYLVQKLLPQGFDALFLVAVLSASMSTLTAILATSAKLVRELIRVELPVKSEFTFYRITAIAIAAACIVAALNPPPMLVVLFGVTTAILSGVLIGPTVYGIFFHRITAPSVVAAMVLSFTAAIAVSAYGGFSFPWTYYAFAPTIVLSLVVPPIVSLFTKPPPKEYVDSLFSRC